MGSKENINRTTTTRIRTTKMRTTRIKTTKMRTTRIRTTIRSVCKLVREDVIEQEIQKIIFLGVYNTLKRTFSYN
jgi:hypothetical protein